MANFTPNGLARLSIILARVFYTLALLALISAWISQLKGGPILGMSQQHLYNDAIVLSLLGIGSFLDALWHSKGRL